ncbi:MAG: ABC transporter permease [Planctomycetes bacterium]|nr:ABC transporter permease [Planctomycetota bacterium]
MNRLGAALLWVFLGVAALAPSLANDKPLLARVGGAWRVPALAETVGLDPGPAPAETWKVWWAELPDEGPDFAVFPPWPHGPRAGDPARIRALPHAAHPLGTDDTGRDVLARLVHGARTALLVGVCAAGLALLLGVPLGLVAGYRGGVADALVLRAVELVLCFPALLLVLAVAAFAGGSFAALVVTLGALSWTGFARIVRAETLALREREFVLTARGLGLGAVRVLRAHVLPQLRGAVATTFAFVAAEAVVVEAALSFLGLGPGLRGVSWGGLLAQGKAHAHEGAWHLWAFPGMALALLLVTLQARADRRARTAG